MLQELPEFPVHTTSLVAEIEKSPVQRVIGVELWSFKICQCRLQLKIGKPIPLSIIDEFVLGFLCETPSAFSTDEICEILGLDRVFVDVSLKNLMHMGAIEATESMKATTIGLKLYKDRRSLKDLREESIDYYECPYFGALTVLPTAGIKAPFFPNTSRLPSYSFSSDLSAERLSQILSFNDSKIVNDELGEEIVESKAFQINGNLTSVHALIWIYDAIEDSAFPRVYCIPDGIAPFVRQEMTQFIADNFAPPEYSIPPTAPAPEEQAQETAKKYRTLLKAVQVSTQPETPQIRLLRSAEIRPFFLKMIREAKKKMLLISPWISDTVVDESLIKSFRQAVQKGCTILIGWGFNVRLEDEERKPSTELLETLSKIRDDSGLPAIHVQWLGHTHNKEIVVDNRSHLLGSFNWLSYRGDYKIRGESVYHIESKENATIASEGIESQFRPHLFCSLKDKDLNKRLASLRFLLTMSFCEKEIQQVIGTHLNELISTDETLEILLILRVHAHLNKLGNWLLDSFRHLFSSGVVKNELLDLLNFIETRRNQFYHELSKNIGNETFVKIGYSEEFRKINSKRKAILTF